MRDIHIPDDTIPLREIKGPFVGAEPYQSFGNEITTVEQG